MAEAPTSALEAELYDLPELLAALVELLNGGQARHVHVDRKREPMEVMVYCLPGDVPRISGALAAVGLRCAAAGNAPSWSAKSAAQLKPPMPLPITTTSVSTSHSLEVSVVAAAAASEVRRGEEVVGWRARRAREEGDGSREG